jgi:hypothetical protein
MSDNDNDDDWWNFSDSEARLDLEISDNDRAAREVVDMISDNNDKENDWWNLSDSEARGDLEISDLLIDSST